MIHLIHQPDLYDLISKYCPINSVIWEIVANRYRTKTGESKMDEGSPYMKYWIILSNLGHLRLDPLNEGHLAEVFTDTG